MSKIQELELKLATLQEKRLNAYYQVNHAKAHVMLYQQLLLACPFCMSKVYEGNRINWQDQLETAEQLFKDVERDHDQMYQGIEMAKYGSH